MKKSIVLPQNTQELREMLVTGIEYFQGSPVKNQNKVNEALAKALGFKNYDTLSPLIESCNKITPLKALISTRMTSGGYPTSVIVIDGIDISSEIFDEEMVDYKLVEREAFISELFTWIGEARESDRSLMINDLYYLRGLNDQFVFSSISTNEYVSPEEDTEEFNRICLEILELNSNLIQPTY